MSATTTCFNCKHVYLESELDARCCNLHRPSIILAYTPTSGLHQHNFTVFPSNWCDAWEEGPPRPQPLSVEDLQHFRLGHPPSFP